MRHHRTTRSWSARSCSSNWRGCPCGSSTRRSSATATRCSTSSTLMLAITQSGETVDTLAAMEEGKAHGAHLASIVNVIGSQAARVSDSVVYMHTGPEIGVASTKAFTASLVDQYLLAVQLGPLRGTLDAEQRRTPAGRPGAAARPGGPGARPGQRGACTRSWRRPSSTTPTSSIWAGASTSRSRWKAR